jgi:hypothetical protein
MNVMELGKERLPWIDLGGDFDGDFEVDGMYFVVLDAVAGAPAAVDLEDETTRGWGVEADEVAEGLGSGRADGREIVASERRGQAGIFRG